MGNDRFGMLGHQARASDPVTSHIAASKIVDTAKGQRLLVFRILQAHPESTSGEIAKIGKIDRYIPSRRLSELVKLGLVRVVGRRKSRCNGNMMQTYTAVKQS